MKIDIRLPNITAGDSAGKLRQMESYMFQLVEQLNWALANVDSSMDSGSAAAAAGSAGAKTTTEAAAQATFNSIKALIIKSADIVNAYTEQISKKLEGEYVAQADFGTYTEQTQQLIQANSKSIEQFYSDLQQVISDVEGVANTLIEVNAHIRSGLLYYDDSGAPVYGLEIGQRTEVDGAEVFNKYARFTADKLSFYDSNDNEVAYISDMRLYITHVEITGSLTLGGFADTVLSDKSVVTRWVVGGV